MLICQKCGKIINDYAFHEVQGYHTLCVKCTCKLPKKPVKTTQEINGKKYNGYSVGDFFIYTPYSNAWYAYRNGVKLDIAFRSKTSAINTIKFINN